MKSGYYSTRIIFLLFIFISCLSHWGCDKGLAPIQTQPPPYGFKGVVYFKNWPPADIIVKLYVVAFRNYPPGDIFNEYQNGNLRFSNDLVPSYGLDSIQYEVDLNPMHVDSIPFVAVGQQYGQNIQQDWRLVGFYHLINDSTKPATVRVFPDSIVEGINIKVDFNNLPQFP